MTAVPHFYLYGEAHRSAAADFVHAEALDDRSRPSEWTIRPHAHADLHHIFLIATGGGTMEAEGRAHDLAAPCLLFVPAATVHGFAFDRESRGLVVTVARTFLEEIVRRDPDLAPLIREARATPLAAPAADAIMTTIADLMRELGWAAPGHRAAVEAALQAILVAGVRAAAPAGAAPAPIGRQAALVARLRERIDARFRLREPVEVHAAALGASATALRVACARIAGAPPMAMLDARALLEAKRALLYSNLTIAQIGHAIGMPDPAYFSRFFARHAGMAPRRFRETRGAIA